MKKIKITKIKKEVHSFRGFDSIGCHGSSCNDACCCYGADVDKESHDLMFKHRKLIEKETGIKMEDCFKKDWYNEKDFLGGDGTETKVGKSGFCVFHTKKGKGCVLYKLITKKKLPRRLIPSICRLYPLSWGNEKLFIAGDLYLYPNCNCKAKNKSSKNILETQKKEIRDIFDIRCKA